MKKLLALAFVAITSLAHAQDDEHFDIAQQFLNTSVQVDLPKDANAAAVAQFKFDSLRNPQRYLLTSVQQAEFSTMMLGKVLYNYKDVTVLVLTERNADGTVVLNMIHDIYTSEDRLERLVISIAIDKTTGKKEARAKITAREKGEYKFELMLKACIMGQDPACK